MTALNLKRCSDSYLESENRIGLDDTKGYQFETNSEVNPFEYPNEAIWYHVDNNRPLMKSGHVDVWTRHLHNYLISKNHFSEFTDTSRIEFHSNIIYRKTYRNPAENCSWKSSRGIFERFSVEKKPEQSWMTTELSDFLNKKANFSLASLVYLISEIYSVYGDVQIKTVIYTDPEEQWTKPIFIIHSDIKNFDDLMHDQDNLFIKAENDSQLFSILPHVIISQE